MLVPSLYRDTRRQTAVRTYSLGHNPPVPETVAIIDFETTGMSPAMGARATEVAAVLVHGGEIVGRFQSLMKSGAWVPPFIEQLTGISNAMLERAPPARAVMHELLRFTKGVPLVAHNAAFDRGFWQAEAERAECEPDEAHRFACTLLLSRRLHPEAPNHRLGTLRAWHALPDAGRAHRALADAETDRPPLHPPAARRGRPLRRDARWPHARPRAAAGAAEGQPGAPRRAPGAPSRERSKSVEPP